MAQERSGPSSPPDTVVRAARERSLARRERDWATADRLRRLIEDAGWRIVDHGLEYALLPAHPPDLLEGAELRYGASTSVPSRLEEPADRPASVVVPFPAGPETADPEAAGLETAGLETVERRLEELRSRLPEETQLVAVVNAPGGSQPPTPGTGSATDVAPAAMAGVEIIRTSASLGLATLLNMGVRRSSGASVVLLDPGVEVSGDFVTPCCAALADPEVGVAGPWGLVSPDLRHFEPAGPGEADAIELACLAFRRADFRDRGPLEERFQGGRYLDVWWSLVLREDDPGGRPRRALALPGLPVRRAAIAEPPASDERSARRNGYLVIERFWHQRERLLGGAARESQPADERS